METINIILCGLGGQGILYMTKVLAQTALRNGWNIMGAETHGMAQRGGSVVSHLRIGEVESSLVRNGSAHFLLSLDLIEAYRNLPFLAPRSKIYVNAAPSLFPQTLVKKYLIKREIRFHSFDAYRIADELGAPMSSNLSLLGFSSAFEKGPFSHESLISTIEKISPDRFKKSNLDVFNAGFEWGRKENLQGAR
ncbi:MAG: indolepyruvate oxidoreductase subunit beta [Desulfatiglans sp.]|jgi:indolepyruvate ferredoxin oxidoreductase beta subunit|nr:indolepyruvate oxidoreductase subunit beta [Thermodesulfobacteriota bacterium]MEE4352914.1 indolepyruvate oxidoreductase subunit beta [Desulfatiglans sp.]